MNLSIDNAIWVMMLVVIILQHEVAHAWILLRCGYQIDFIQIGLALPKQIRFHQITLPLNIQIGTWKGIPIFFNPIFLMGAIGIKDQEFDKPVNNSVLKRIAVLAAGPLINIVTAFLAISLIINPLEAVPMTINHASIFLTEMTQEVGNKITRSWSLWEKQQTPTTYFGSLTTVAMSVRDLRQQTGWIQSSIIVFYVLSLMTGIMNLLIPIPGLDGGRILLILTELGFGRTIQPALRKINNLGVLAFLGLMLLLVIF